MSVGRGTLFPFQVAGSPDLRKTFSFHFTPKALEGFDKHPLHRDHTCYGIDLRTTDQHPQGFSLQYVIQFYRAYQFLYPDAEKRFFTRPRWFDLLMGTSQVRKDILQGKTETEIRRTWEKDLQLYRAIRAKYLLYE